MIVIIGATGYIGGRLLKRLEEEGAALRCMARTPSHLQGRVAPSTEIVAGDLLEPDTLAPALKGAETAYYLAHSMGDHGDFEERELQAARNFAAAAKAAGVRRIVYLGGLGEDGGGLSKHLRSRHHVGELLRQSGVLTIEFRASIVIGSGSLSFELVRSLVRALPVMITPKWLEVKAQPIAITDLLQYLLLARAVPVEESVIYEIGGADVVTYGEILREYARQRGLRRYFIKVPVLTPRLSSLWLHLVTPVHANIGRKLIESISHPTVVQDDRATRDFAIRPVGNADAIAQALRYEDKEFAETKWSHTISALAPRPAWGGVTFGSRIIDCREVTVGVAPDAAFAPVRRIGGRQGWYYANVLWAIRGFLDILAGGVGLRRGRRDPETPYVGDAIDWWRVEAYEPDARLYLFAEMKVPGRAWLEFTVEPAENSTIIRQTAIFDPLGVPGLAYWYALYILHQFVFNGMLRNIAQTAEPGRRHTVRRCHPVPARAAR
ncbi:MAG: DUF2867 domain-containing protein [Candidatus Hydrogenedens sp.]|nr:DUF2867 domain-containing protein [Candidatus Hydrogenedens sp.]